MTTDRHDPDATPELSDEFWGEQTEWAPQPDRSVERAGIGATIARWWDGLLGGGVASERSHGSPVRPQLDDSDRLPEHPDIAGETSADRFEDDVAHDDADGRDEPREVWTIEPEPRSNPGVDPLIARLGGLAVILTLAAPVILGFTASDTDSESAGSLLASTASVAELTAAASTAATDEPVVAETGQPTTAGSTTATPAAGGGGAADVGTEPAASTPASMAAASLEDVAEPEPPATAPPCGSRYELAAGDYWIRIADAAGVSLADLLAVNGSSVDTVLVPGRTVCLPAGATTPAPPSSAAPARATTAPSNNTSSTRSPVATAAPTTTAPSRPAAVSQSRSAQIIRDVWPDDLEDRALEIAWRESNHRSDVNNWCCYGLFQIHWTAHRSWLATIGVTSATQLLDPTVNATAAYTLYRRAGGFGPWGG